MNVLTFIQKDKNAPENYGCGKCLRFWGQYKADAENCCAPKVCACTTEIPGNSYYTICEECRHAKTVAAEAAQFDEAKKVPAHEYEGHMVYWKDQYAHDPQELADRFEARPGYVWGTEEVHFTLDAEDVVTTALECDTPDDEAYDRVSAEDLRELQKFLNAWCKKVDLKWYVPDETVAVLIPPVEDDD